MGSTPGFRLYFQANKMMQAKIKAVMMAETITSNQYRSSMGPAWADAAGGKSGMSPIRARLPNMLPLLPDHPRILFPVVSHQHKNEPGQQHNSEAAGHLEYVDNGKSVPALRRVVVKAEEQYVING